MIRAEIWETWKSLKAKLSVWKDGKVVVYKPFVAPWQEAYSSKYSHNYNAPEVTETTPPPISCYEEYQFCLGQILKSLGVNISSPSISLEDIEFAIKEFKKRLSAENQLPYDIEDFD